MASTNKSMFHKIISVLTFLFCLLISISVYAADGLIYFSDPESKVGETVDVTMTIQCDGTTVSNANVMLKYSADTLQFVSGTDASGGAGFVAVRGKGTLTGDGKNVYTLTFKTPSAGEFTVNIDTCDVTDSSGASVNITHKGSSKITVASSENVAADVKLSILEISPGSLEPAFSPDILEYTAMVGLSVDKLGVNAKAADDSCSVELVNANDLKQGDNDVAVYVKSADGSQQAVYHILVTKAEGGVENITTAVNESETVDTANGVQLSCKGKTITIMDPGSQITIPVGFRSSTIKIDGQPVQGWISENDTDPEYFLVYGMNDAGDLNFYRYDRIEKTIQRYFTDASDEESISPDELKALQDENAALKDSVSSRKLIIWILGVVVFLLLCILIYLIVKLSTLNKELDEKEEGDDPEQVVEPVPRRNRRSSSRADELARKVEQVTESIELGNTQDAVLSGTRHNTRNPESEEDDYTKVLGHGERRRTSRRAVMSPDETTVLRRTRERRQNSTDSFEDV